jgi:hypothetical protein
VVGFLKTEFKVEGIMGSRFKPYPYVLGIGERMQVGEKFIKSVLIILDNELCNDLLIGCRYYAAIVFVL